MNPDARTVEERFGSEVADGSVRRTVHAIGACGVHDPIPSRLWRTKWALDAKSYPEALNAVLTIAISIREKQRLRINPVEPLAEEVLRYWLAPVCPSCFGRKADVIEGTPHLGIACEVCRGTGTRGYPWAGSQHDRFCREVLYALQDAEVRMRNRLLDKLAHQIRDAGVLTTAIDCV